MSFTEYVKEKESNFEEAIDLQKSLFSLDSLNFESTLNYILSSKYILTRDSFSILLRCINQSFEMRPLSFSFYLEIIKSTKKQIETFFSSYELISDLIQNNFLRFKLYEYGIISISTIICYLKQARNDLNLFFVFAFEIEKNEKALFRSYMCQSYKFREYIKSITKEQHLELLSKGLSQEKIAFLIRSNDSVGFQSFHSSTNTNLDQKLNSFYENSLFSFENNISLIEYAALFGAVDVFKYLILNGATVSCDLPKFSIIGGNYEIIHILEQNGVKFDDTKYLDIAIKYHRNELVEYIKESLGIEYSDKSLKKSLKFYNLSVFLSILKYNNELSDLGNKKENIIDLAVRYGYLDIVKMFSKFIKTSEEKNKLLLTAVNNRRFDTFKFLHSMPFDENKDKNNELNCNLFLISASIGHLNIFKYMIQFIDKNYFDIFNEMKNSILILAASYGDLEFVKYVISLGPNESQLNHRNVYGIFLFFLTLFSTFNCC